MIAGTVHNREPIIALNVLGTRRRERIIQAVLDTGYTGYLTLPSETIRQLGLRYKGRSIGLLADGTVREMECFHARAEIGAEKLSIVVECSEAASLAGMSLLEGLELNIEVREGGRVTITNLP